MDDIRLDEIRLASDWPCDAEHKGLTKLARRVCQSIFGEDYDQLEVSDWPHIASYFCAKKLRMIQPDSDEGSVVINAFHELMAPYSSWKQRQEVGFGSKGRCRTQAEPLEDRSGEVGADQEAEEGARIP